MKKSILLISLLMASMFASAQMLTKSGESYLYKGGLISESEMVSVLQLQCPVAYEQYLTGQRLQRIGRGLWIAGIPTTITGVGMMVGGIIMYYKNDPSYNNYDPMYYHDGLTDVLLLDFGALIASAGISMEVANIPLQIVGKHKRSTAYEEYNEKCNHPSDHISFNLQTTSNGLGLALKF